MLSVTQSKTLSTYGDGIPCSSEAVPLVCSPCKAGIQVGPGGVVLRGSGVSVSLGSGMSQYDIYDSVAGILEIPRDSRLLILNLMKSGDWRRVWWE